MICINEQKVTTRDASLFSFVICHQATSPTVEIVITGPNVL